MISEQYKQSVWRKFEVSGFKQPETKEELDIIIELQSRGQKPKPIRGLKRKRTVPKQANEVRAFDRLMRDAFDY